MTPQWHRVIEKHRGEAEGLLLRRYPAFVLDDRAGIGDRIPVFAFHRVVPADLEPVLSFLADNGYETLTVDRYVERLGAPARPDAREVMLTFDDGHVSLHRVAFPALQRLGLTAVVYVVPGRVPVAGAPPARALCDWAELEEMHRAGAIDLQSHSHLHHSIAISSRIVDFVRPGLSLSFLDSDLAPLAAQSAGPEARNGAGSASAPVVGAAAPPAPGAPIHAWGARLSERPAWREAAGVESACTDEVLANGGPAYFTRAGWKSRLHVVASGARRQAPGRLESEAEQRQAILDDLRASIRTIEARIPGARVRHLCYPWYRGSALASRLAREAGFVTEAWGSRIPGFAGSADMPLPIRRLPPELLWRLPGRGRRSLIAILRSRWGRTLSEAGRDA